MFPARIVFSLVTVAALGGCGAATRDFATWNRNYERLELQSLELGDSKGAVEQKLGPPVNVIGSKRFERGTVEVWAYEKWLSQFGYDRKEEEYWLYFLDGGLEQWGRPGDWQSEADRIYEIRYR